jgi:hypothetical protein
MLCLADRGELASLHIRQTLTQRQTNRLTQRPSRADSEALDSSECTGAATSGDLDEECRIFSAKSEWQTGGQ